MTTGTEDRISPDWVRISAAAAMELGLKPGRIHRCGCGCINLLQSYPEGCFANCSYCGLARERPGEALDNTFIRVAWPLFPTDLVAERIAAVEAERVDGDLGERFAHVANVLRGDHQVQRDELDRSALQRLLVVLHGADDR